MFTNLINITKSAAAFLQNGIAPPNCAPEIKRTLEEENHLSSKKFFIIFTSVVMLGALYYSSVAILLTIKMPEHVTAFVTIFSKTIEIFAVIIASYLGVQAVVDLKYNSSSNTDLRGIIETIDHDITENLTKNSKEEDYTLEDVNEKRI
jgi:hypothetical protein